MASIFMLWTHIYIKNTVYKFKPLLSKKRKPLQNCRGLWNFFLFFDC